MNGVSVDPWQISRISEADAFSESIFFVGNGRVGIRGFGAWARKTSPQEHAIFCAGLFGQIAPGITDMVQLPDVLTFLVDDEPPVRVEQRLDMRLGVLEQRWETARADYLMTRMASMDDDQLIVQRLEIRAKQAGAFIVRAVEDASVANLPVNDDQMVEATELTALLRLEAVKPGHIRASVDGRTVDICWSFIGEDAPETSVSESVVQDVFCRDLRVGECWTLEKRIRVITDGATPRADGADPWDAHCAAWARLWDECDMLVEADDAELQGAVRYNIFQLLGNACGDRRVSIGARGLTHGRYKGNTFWDTEIFLLPFYLWTRPELAKALLLYRFDRLADARALARKQSMLGARFPWMCSDTGSEQCTSWDIGQCETHITADVAYAMQRYVEVTGDQRFLSGSAVPVYLETARYWLSRLTYEPDADRYSSFFVKGPDEYCGATVNNTYTNYMARNNLRLALKYAQPDASEAEHMRHAEQRVAILYDEKRKLFLQDELLDRMETAPFLKDVGAPAYQRVSYDRLKRYRVLKQADLVLLATLFPDDFTEEQKANIFAYYEPITLHDSTLSYGVHAQLAMRIGAWAKAADYLDKAVYLDLHDLMSNTGKEGLHMAALGAAWQALVFGAAGLWARDDELTLAPALPPEIHRLRFRFVYRAKRYEADVTQTGHSLREVE